MKQPHLCFAIVGLCFGTTPKGNSQTSGNATLPPSQNCTCQRCTTADSTSAVCSTLKPQPSKKLLEGLQITGGQLTVPFKIRHKLEHNTFHLTTDVTLGAFIGLTKRLSREKEHYLTLPITAGLTFININENNTTLEFSATNEGGTEVIPGLSWSSGIILQLDQYNLGLIFGKDYASELGDQWIYHRKWWWSFGLGFSFTK